MIYWNSHVIIRDKNKLIATKCAFYLIIFTIHYFGDNGLHIKDRYMIYPLNYFKDTLYTCLIVMVFAVHARNEEITNEWIHTNKLSHL